MRKLVLLFSLLALLLLTIVPAFAQDNPSIPELLANDADGRFTTLLAAVEAAGLVDALSGEGPFTVLAPTNDAFAAALDYLGLDAADLLADTETLTQVLTYHVLPERLFFRNLTSGPTVATLQGDTVTFNLTDGLFTVEGGQILDVDNVASNGVVHVLEAVILPPAIREAAAANRAHIRFAHFSVDAGAVDIWVDQQVSELTGVTIGTVSEWQEVAAGSYSIGLAAPGGRPTKTELARVPAGGWITIAVVGQASTRDLDIVFLPEDYSAPATGQARISVLHAIQNAPAVDILVNGAPLIVNLNFPRSVGTNDGFDVRNIGGGTATVAVNVYGTDTEIMGAERAFEAGVNYFIVAAGTPTAPQLLVYPTNIAEATGAAAE